MTTCFFQPAAEGAVSKQAQERQRQSNRAQHHENGCDRNPCRRFAAIVGMEAHVGKIRCVPDRVSTKARPAFSGVNTWLTGLAQEKENQKENEKENKQENKQEKEKSRHQHSADDGLKIHSPAEHSATWLKNGETP
jgi:hypothetical protein